MEAGKLELLGRRYKMCSAEYLITPGLNYEAAAAALMALEPLDVVD